MKNIPISGPWITDKEVEYVADATRNAWYSDANMYHERFERAFAEYLGVKYAVALPSCTSALHEKLTLDTRAEARGGNGSICLMFWYNRLHEHKTFEPCSL